MQSCSSGWRVLQLPYIPRTHFARVFAALEPKEFKDSFLMGSSITERLGIELIHIDGKTARFRLTERKTQSAA